MGVVDDPVSALGDPHAEVHVVEGDREALVESAHLVEDLAPQHHAGRGHRAHVAHPRPVHVQVEGDLPVAQAHPAVLQVSVRVAELTSDRAHLRALGVLQESLQPVGDPNEGVVVEEEDVGRGAGAHPEIHDTGEVEGARGAHHLMPGRVEIAQRLRRLAVVVDDDDADVRVGGARLDLGDALTQEVHPVAGRDDHLDAGMPVQLVADVVAPRHRRLVDMSFDPASRQGVLDRALARLPCQRFGIAAQGSRAGHLPP